MTYPAHDRAEIVRLRDLGFSQTDIAARVGCSQALVSQIAAATPVARVDKLKKRPATDRYYVTETHGRRTASTGGGALQQLAVTVLDRVWNHRVIHWFDSTGIGGRDGFGYARGLAEQMCDRLNDDERAWEQNAA